MSRLSVRYITLWKITTLPGFVWKGHRLWSIWKYPDRDFKPTRFTSLLSRALPHDLNCCCAEMLKRTLNKSYVVKTTRGKKKKEGKKSLLKVWPVLKTSFVSIKGKRSVWHTTRLSEPSGEMFRFQLVVRQPSDCIRDNWRWSRRR